MPLIFLAETAREVLHLIGPNCYSFQTTLDSLVEFRESTMLYYWMVIDRFVEIGH